MQDPQEFEGQSPWAKALKQRPAARMPSAPDPPTREVGTGRGVLDSIFQGMTFGFGDEIQAGIGAGLDTLMGDGSFRENYATEVADVRDRIDAFRDQSLVLSTVGEIGGGILTGGAALKGIRAASSARGPVGRAVSAATARVSGAPAWQKAVGGVMAGGAAYGAGEADGDLAERGVGAATGAVVAAPIALVPGAAAAAGRAVRRTTDAFLPVARSSASLRRQAQDEVIGRLRGGGRSAQVIRNRLRGIDADGMPAGAARRIGADEPVTLMELGGSEVQGMAARVGNTPGPGRARLTEFVRNRQAGQFDRVSGALREGMETTNRGTNAMMRELVDRQRELASPMYQRAFEETPLITDGPVMELFRSGRIPRRAFARAREIARTESGRDILQGIDNGVLSSQDAHYIKVALGDMIGAARTGGERQLGRARTGLAQEFAEAMKESIPGYREAAEVFASEASLQEALEAGRTALRSSTTREDVADAVARMTAPERRAYTLGAINDYVEKLANRKGTTNLADDFGKNREALVEKLRTIGADAEEAVEAMIGRLGRESDMTMARNAADATIGSKSIPLAAEMADSGMMRFARHLAGGHPVRAVSGLVGEAIQRAHGQGGRINDEIAKILTATGTELTEELEALIQREIQRQTRGSAVGAGSFVAGGLIGG